mgnify:CR=1 FL=1
MKKADANTTAWKLLNDQPDLTIRELAELIGCSVGLIAKTAAWKQTAAERKRANGPAKPTAVNLSDGLQKVTASDAEPDPLEKLIAEQEKDFEPSPFEPARRKIRNRKSI